MILIRAEDVIEESGAAYHGGHGEFSRRTLFENIDGSDINYLRDIVLPVGTSVGIHYHKSDEEIFYFISGNGSVFVDGEKQKVNPGSLVLTLPGSSHGVVNDGSVDLRFIAINVRNRLSND